MIVLLLALAVAGGILIGIAIQRHLAELPLDVTLGPPLP